MKILQIVFGTLIVILLAFSVFQSSGRGGAGGISSELVFVGNATNTSVAVGQSLNVATATVLSANTDRSYASICNIGTTTTDICFHSTSCTFGTGFPLSPFTISSTTPNCYEINRNNLYGGAIIGVVAATSSTSTLSIIEK